jgi:hypothetical protein
VTIISGIVLSLSLEAAKVLTWRLGGVTRIVSVALIGVSLLASLCATYETIAISQSSETLQRLGEVQRSTGYVLLISQINRLTETEAILKNRLNNLPIDYNTTSTKILTELRSLQAEINGIQEKLILLEQQQLKDAPKRSKTAFLAFLADTWGIPSTSVLMSVVFILSLLLEICAVILAGSIKVSPNHPIEHPNESPNHLIIGGDIQRHQEILHPIDTELGDENEISPNDQEDVSPDDYLRIAIDHPKAPYLIGKTQVAQRLGVSDHTARMLLTRLVQSKKVIRQGKYFIAAGK